MGPSKPKADEALEKQVSGEHASRQENRRGEMAAKQAGKAGAGFPRGKRLAVVGDADGWYVRDLQRAAEQAGHELPCFSFADLSTEIACTNDPLEATVNSSLSEFEAVIVRIMPLGSLEQIIFRMDCLQLVESAGIPVINPPRCLEISIDKWLTLHRLQQRQIPVPATVACQQREDALRAFQQLGEDVVVKPIFGGEGRGMIRVTDLDMAWRVFSTLQQTRSVMYVQQFTRHMGYDIRVLRIGELLLSVKRHATGENWRTNVSQGSRVEEHVLSEQERQLVSSAALAVAGESDQPTVLGIDLLPCADGVTRILEVNAVPGWRAVARVLKVDVAAEVIRMAAKS